MSEIVILTADVEQGLLRARACMRGARLIHQSAGNEPDLHKEANCLFALAERYLACAEARMSELEQTQRTGELPDRDEKSKCIDILNGVQAHKAAGGCRQTDS